MDVSFDWGIGLALALFVLLAPPAVIWASYQRAVAGERRYIGASFSRPIFFLTRSLTALVAYAVIFGGVAWVSSDPIQRPVTSASTVELAAHFGLDSGKEYPLILGATQGSGAIGSVTSRGGLFGSHSTVSLRPTSTATVGFQKDDSWWQLTLPTETIEYRVGEVPSMTVVLKERSYRASASTVGWQQHVSDCDWSFRNFWTTCSRTAGEPELIVSESTQREGLARVVNSNFHSALIILTEDQHNELFPKN